MICPFCSLLCDADDPNELKCERRSVSLVKFRALRAAKGSQKQAVLNEIDESQESEYVDRLQIATKSLLHAKRILVTGRIANVATARAAVAFAAKYNATIDCAESGHAFKNILAIQRSGLNSVSLAEARDHTDLFIVVGNDSMQAAIPRMPFALRTGNPRRQTLLLLGEFSPASTEVWQQAGFDVWSVPCDLMTVPSALAQWSRWSGSNPVSSITNTSLSNPLFEQMAQAQYTTVVWSVENIAMDQADLWVERLLQWIANRNETTRCAALPWSSMDATFQQVCTWLTGFPGRVAFQDGVPSYDPQRNSYEHWIARTSADNSAESAIVLIDETVAATPYFDSIAMRDSGVNTVIELTGNSERFPTAIAGVETSADMFRADQMLLAHVTPSNNPGAYLKSAASWLEGLSK